MRLVTVITRFAKTTPACLACRLLLADLACPRLPPAFLRAPVVFLRVFGPSYVSDYYGCKQYAALLAPLALPVEAEALILPGEQGQVAPTAGPVQGDAQLAAPKAGGDLTL